MPARMSLRPPFVLLLRLFFAVSVIIGLQYQDYHLKETKRKEECGQQGFHSSMRKAPTHCCCARMKPPESSKTHEEDTKKLSPVCSRRKCWLERRRRNKQGTAEQRHQHISIRCASSVGMPKIDDDADGAIFRRKQKNGTVPRVLFNCTVCIGHCHLNDTHDFDHQHFSDTNKFDNHCCNYNPIICKMSNNMINLLECCRSVGGSVGNGHSYTFRHFSLVSLVLTVSALGDQNTKRKLKPIFKAVLNTKGLRELIKTAVKGHTLINEKKNYFDDDRPLWQRFCSFNSINPVASGVPNSFSSISPGGRNSGKGVRHTFARPSTYIVAPATSFLPEAGSNGKDQMAYLGCRLASLAALPPSCNVSRSRLAQAGFYYDSGNTSRDSSNMHEVVCHSCGLTWARWEAGDNPMVIHRRMRPDCEYIKSQGPDIFPQDTSAPPPSVSSGPSSLSSFSTFSTDSSLSSTSSLSSLTSSSSFTSDASQASSVAGVVDGMSHLTVSSGYHSASGIGSTPTAYENYQGNGLGDLATDCASIAPEPLPPNHVTPPGQSGHSYSSLQTTTALSQSGASARNSAAFFDDQDDRPQLYMDSAVYPQFSTISERLATFDRWPLGQYFKPDDLVYDGFYYAGYADCLRCFYCGVGLKSWDRNDSVLDEHIRWRPSCGFILAVKGRRFVQRTLQRLGAANPQEGTETPRSHTSTGASAVRNGAPQIPASNTTRAGMSDRTSANSSDKTQANASNRAPVNTSTSGQKTAKDAIQVAREMGYSEELIARATQDLQEPGTTVIDTEVFINYLMSLTSGENGSESNGIRSNTSADLHTDGAHALEANPLSERAQQALRENERLRGLKTCKICHRGTVGVIFLPCGHLLACTDCASHTRNCTRCGQYIRATANVYLS